MPIDPSIPFRALTGGGQSTINPLGMLSDVLQVQQQHEALKAMQARRQEYEQQQQLSARELEADRYIRELLQQSGDDPEAAFVQAVKAGYAPEAYKLAESFGKARKELALKTRAQLEAEEQAYQTLGRAAQGVDAYGGGWDLFRTRALNIDPQLESMIPVQYDPAVAQQVQQLAWTGAQFAGLQKEALDHALNGDWPSGLGKALLATRDQQTYDQALEEWRILGAPKSLLAAAPKQFGPEAQAWAEKIALGPQKPGATAEGAKLGSFEDYVARYAQSVGKAPEALTPADIELARKRYGQADDRPRITVNTPGSDVALTPEAIDMAAAQYRILGTRGLPTRIDANDRKRIMNAASEQMKVLGQSPAQVLQKQAGYKADAAALAQMRKMQSSASAFENKATAQIDIIKQISPKVPRTMIPKLNEWIISGKTELLGDTNAQQLVNAITTFSAEYAKIIEGSTGSAAGSTDSARRASERLVRASMNPGTLDNVLDLMKREMALTITGYDATIQHISERLGGGAMPADAPAAAPTEAAPPLPKPDWVWDPVAKKLRRP